MTQAVEILRCEGDLAPIARGDEVPREDPLEIRVNGQLVAVAMRTPGQDRELAAGWALSEGIIQSAADLADVILSPGDESGRGVMADVILNDPRAFNPDKVRRNVLTNASCGLCGAASVDQILRAFPKVSAEFPVERSILYALPDRMREAQVTFQRTGGVHACGLFDDTGRFIALREDVGRHNALDKLNGWALMSGLLPLTRHILLLSGRVSLEMVQKAVAAGISVVAAIGAPSSLAVELARASGQCLVGFLRGESCNLYAGMDRLRGTGRHQ